MDNIPGYIFEIWVVQILIPREKNPVEMFQPNTVNAALKPHLPPPSQLIRPPGYRPISLVTKHHTLHHSSLTAILNKKLHQIN